MHAMEAPVPHPAAERGGGGNSQALPLALSGDKGACSCCSHMHCPGDFFSSTCLDEQRAHELPTHQVAQRALHLTLVLQAGGMHKGQ